MFYSFLLTDFLLRFILLYKAFCSACMVIPWPLPLPLNDPRRKQHEDPSWDATNQPTNLPCQQVLYWLNPLAPPKGYFLQTVCTYISLLVWFLPVLSTFGQIGSWSPKKGLSIDRKQHEKDKQTENTGNRTRIVTSILVCTSLLCSKDCGIKSIILQQTNDSNSRGRTRHAPPKGPSSFILTYKFYKT